MLSERIQKHGAHVWLLNTGWTGGAYGTGKRFSLKYTRAMVHAIQSGSLLGSRYTQDPIFGLHIPYAVHGVPHEVWADEAGAAEDEQVKRRDRRPIRSEGRVGEGFEPGEQRTARERG